MEKKKKNLTPSMESICQWWGASMLLYFSSISGSYRVEGRGCGGGKEHHDKHSGQFSHSVMSNSFWAHEPQHARPPVHHQLPESTQTHVHWVGDAIQPSHPPSSPSPPAFNLSQHQGLSNESALRIRWSKYWSFSFNISPSSEHPGLISFRMD